MSSRAEGTTRGRPTRSARAKKTVIATDAVKRAIEEDGEVTVTVVPIIEPLPYDNVEERYTKDPVHIGYVRILTYR